MTTVRTIAVFDLDGTLTRRDTLLAFLRRVSGARRTVLALVAAGPRLALSRIGPAAGREAASHAAKEAVIGRLLAGRDLAALASEARAFAETVVAHDLRPDVVARVGHHRRAGHQLAMVTASPELYAGPIGELLGFDVVLGTRLETNAEGALTGRLQGSNCRGTEKVERLRDWAGTGEIFVHAYGDSAGDRRLLESADTAVTVGRRRLA